MSSQLAPVIRHKSRLLPGKCVGATLWQQDSPICRVDKRRS